MNTSNKCLRYKFIEKQYFVETKPDPTISSNLQQREKQTVVKT